MAARQYKHLYHLLGQLNISDPDLIGDMIWNVTGGRTSHKSELHPYEYQKLIDNLELQCGNKPSKGKGKVKDMDKMRKKVLATIFRYFELQNQTVTIEYVQAVACQATCSVDFNKISYEALNRIYHEFTKKQRIVGLINDTIQADPSHQSEQPPVIDLNWFYPKSRTTIN